MTMFQGEAFFSEEVVVLDGGSGYKEGFVSPLIPIVGDINGFRYVFRVDETKSTKKRTPIEEIVGDDGTKGQANFTTAASGVVADKILDELVSQIDGKAGFTAEKIGNGIYFTRTDPFAVDVKLVVCHDYLALLLMR